MEIENNSFLDFNTNSGGNGSRVDYGIANTSSATKLATNLEESSTGVNTIEYKQLPFDMMTEISDHGDLIVNFEVLIPSNHPVLQSKIEDLEKNTNC